MELSLHGGGVAAAASVLQHADAHVGIRKDLRNVSEDIDRKKHLSTLHDHDMSSCASLLAEWMRSALEGEDVRTSVRCGRSDLD